MEAKTTNKEGHMESAGIKILVLLITVIFNFYMFLVMMRFLLQWVKADFRNPFCQFLMKITNPLLIPLRKVIPGFYGLDFAAIVLMYAIQIVQLSLLSYILIGLWSPSVFIAGIFGILKYYVNTMFFVIIINAIMSWFSTSKYNPMVILIQQLSEPWLSRIRKIIPAIAGLDFSPLIALVILQIINILLSSFY